MYGAQLLVSVTLTAPRNCCVRHVLPYSTDCLLALHISSRQLQAVQLLPNQQRLSEQGCRLQGWTIAVLNTRCVLRSVFAVHSAPRCEAI